MANKKVVLTKPLVGHEAVREIEFREPMWDDYSEHGEPFVWTPAGETPEGDKLYSPTPLFDAVKAYAERLLVINGKPGDPLMLSQLNLADSRAVKDAIIGFFRDDEKATEGSKTSPTISSSNSDGDRTSSAG